MITQGLQNSTKKKNSIYSTFVIKKNENLKEVSQNNHNSYRNLLSALLKREKEKHFSKFFNENIKDIKKTWIGIKSLSVNETKNNGIASIIRNNEKCINDPIAIFQVLFHINC